MTYGKAVTRLLEIDQQIDDINEIYDALGELGQIEASKQFTKLLKERIRLKIFLNAEKERGERGNI